MTISSKTRMHDYMILSLNLSESVKFNYIGMSNAFSDKWWGI